MSFKRAVIVVLLASAFAVAPAGAADVVVGSGPGTCTEAALASAVAVVSAAGGTITFDCGGPATITLTTQQVFKNSKNLGLVYTIDGGGNVTLSGGGTTRILYQSTGTLNVRNITLTAGLAQGAAEKADGGAIRSEGQDVANAAPLHLNLTNVTFAGNATNLTSPPVAPHHPFDYGGGAVFTRWGVVTVTGCTFTGNGAYNTSGGALHGRSSTISIVGSRFTGNLSNGGGFGGAIWVDGLSPAASGVGGTLRVSATTFSGNISRNQGGAVGYYLYPEKSESAVFDTVSVVGNQVLDSSGTYLGTRAFGGGIHGERGDVSVVNSTVADNVVRSTATGGSGGGLSLVSNGSVTIANTTISNNRAEGPSYDAIGGGLLVSGNVQPFLVTHATIASNFSSFSGGGISGGSNGTLRNTIVSGNDALYYDQCGATLTNGGGVLEYPAGSPACVSGTRLTADPRLGPLASNGGFSTTHLLLAGSPAIDAGACVVARDQRGVARPQGAACDLGAVEVGEPGPPATDLYTLSPCRVVDTRLPSGPTGGAPLVCGVEQVFTLAGGSCGVPGTARAVAANVAAVGPSKQGYMNAYPSGAYPPLTSVVNYNTAVTRANNAVIPLNGAGQVAVRCAPTGTSHVVIDVNGYFQ